MHTLNQFSSDHFLLFFQVTPTPSPTPSFFSLNYDSCSCNFQMKPNSSVQNSYSLQPRAGKEKKQASTVAQFHQRSFQAGRSCMALLPLDGRLPGLLPARLLCLDAVLNDDAVPALWRLLTLRDLPRLPATLLALEPQALRRPPLGLVGCKVAMGMPWSTVELYAESCSFRDSPLDARTFCSLRRKACAQKKRTPHWLDL